MLLKAFTQPSTDLHGTVPFSEVESALNTVGFGEDVVPEVREANEMRCCLAAYIPVAAKRFIDNAPQLLKINTCKI